MQFFCAQLEHTRDRVYFTNGCIACGKPRSLAELPAVGIVNFNFDNWRVAVKYSVANAWQYTLHAPQILLGQVVMPGPHPAPDLHSPKTCCKAPHASSAYLTAAEICDAAIWGLAALKAMIVTRYNEQLDCAAEKRARAERRARWRLSVYALLVLGDSCVLAPDVARQIVVFALPFGPLAPAAE